MSDRTVDLISEGVDLAVRGGNLHDSSLIAKKISSSYFALYASAQYLKNNETILHPKDLKGHRCIQFLALGRDKWALSNGKQTVTVPMSEQFVIDDLGTIKEMTISGQGVGLLPSFICIEEVTKKRLVRVLPDWKSEVRPVSFVYPPNKFILPKLRSFMDIAEEIIKLKLQE